MYIEKRLWLLLLLPWLCGPSFASLRPSDDLLNVVRELTWSTPNIAPTYQYTKHLNKNLGHAVAAMQEFKPALALSYASRCQGDAIREHKSGLAKLCSAVASAFADAAGRPDIGLYWASQAGREKSHTVPVFDQLDQYLTDNASAVELFVEQKPALRQKNISFPSVTLMKMHLATLPSRRGDSPLVRLPAITATGSAHPVSFFLDSGAPSFLSTNAAKSLGFSSYGWSIRVNTLDHCNAHLERGRLSAFDLGDTRLTGVVIWRSVSSCAEYSAVNVIGYDLLYRARRVFIDYDKKIVALGSGLSKWNVGMGDAVCMKLGFRFSPILVEGNISVLGNVQGTNVSVMPDVGNSVGVMITPSAYRRLVSSGATQPASSDNGMVSLHLTLGGKTFAVEAIIRDNPVDVDMILPYKFFKKWYFDYEDGIFCGSA